MQRPGLESNASDDLIIQSMRFFVANVLFTAKRLARKQNFWGKAAFVALS